MEQMIAVLSRPYSVTKSKLGTATKVYNQNFICNEKGVLELNETILEKLRLLNPVYGGFQYLISFSDHTHIENQELQTFSNVIRQSGKITERLVLKWVIKHNIEDFENDLTIIVRIINPINPLVFLQAALSKSPEDIDNLEFEGGSVSASVDGAGQVMAEEIFAVVSRWLDSRPQPQNFLTIHETIIKNKNKIEFMNCWILPILMAAALFSFLWKTNLGNLLIPSLFLSIAAHTYTKNIGVAVTKRIDKWCRQSRYFSAFELTGGDSNQQAKFAARSRNSTIKLIITTVITFIFNVAAGITATILCRS